MSQKLAISITYGKNNPERATFGFIMANTAVLSLVETVVFLNIDGVYLGTKGYADDIHEEGLSPLKSLIESFVEAGGKIWICGTCFKKRQLDSENLIDGAVIVGAATFIEYLKNGATCINY
ncbi:MAG TPA: DsrE family protein [Haloplasmataceae bacterium]